MDYTTIRFDNDDGLAVIALDRPEKANALNTQMRAELTDAVKRARREARVIVMTGQGATFCAGQDLGDARNAEAIDLESTLRDEYEPMLRAIVEAEIPVIAAVNGAAAGAGANLALTADVVIAAQSASFLQAFSKIGLVPDAGGSYLLPRAIGLPRAMGAALFAEKITAQQAADWGMIWEAVSDMDFEAHWRARARHLADGPTQAFKGIKRLMQTSLGNGLEDQLALEAQVQGQMGRSRDFREGVLAFLEKRPAAFEGR